MIKILAICGLVVVASAAPNSNFVRKINDDTTGVKIEPINLGHASQGDIVKNNNRNAIFGKAQRWEKGVIPYIFGTDYGKLTSNITTAMRSIEAKTCIKFVPRTSEKDYIRIIAANGVCNSAVGRNGNGAQDLRLSHSQTATSIQTCLSQSTIVHELMHAIGLDHEHNRADRDKAVTVHEARVKADLAHNFEISNPVDFYDYGCPYNYESVMHYDKTSFGKTPGQVTMEVKDPKYANVIGNVPDAHPTDYEKINRIYECNTRITVKGHTCKAIPKPTCLDDPKNQAYCEQVGRRGQCNADPENLRVCKKTCNGCIGVEMAPPPCEDDPQNLAYCKQEAGRNKCQGDTLMICRKSCKQC